MGTHVRQVTRRRRLERRALVMLLALAVASTSAVRDGLSTDEGLFDGVVVAMERTASVWDGVYTDQQALRGEATYRQECTSCHYADLQGQGATPPLVGEVFFSRWGDLSMDDMLTVIRTTMPQGAPASLGNGAYLDVMAYLLKSNGMPAGDVELSDDRERLRQVIIRERRLGD